MDLKALIAKIDHIAAKKTLMEAGDPKEYARAQQQMARLEKAAQYTGDDEIVRQRMGLPPKLPPIEQWDGKMPQPTGKPDWVARLTTGGQATTDQATAVATNKADDTSTAFVKEKVARLKELIAKISAPASESIVFKSDIAKKLIESFNYSLNEAYNGTYKDLDKESGDRVTEWLEDWIGYLHDTDSHGLASDVQSLLDKFYDGHVGFRDVKEFVFNVADEPTSPLRKDFIKNFAPNKIRITQPDLFNEADAPGGKFQNEVAEIKQIMGELSDIGDSDTEVAQVLADAQAALDKLAAPVAQAGGTDKNKLPDTPPEVSMTPDTGSSANPPASDPGTIDPNKLKRFKELLDKAEAGSAANPPAAGGQQGKPAAFTPAELKGQGSYTIKPGDTLSKIAAANKTTVQAIMAANPQIKDANRIAAGAKLNIPTSQGSSANPPASQGSQQVPGKTFSPQVMQGTMPKK